MADSTIGRLIRGAEAGDGSAAGELFAALYGELHAIAGRQLQRAGDGITLGTTTLLHEAYLNIAAREGVQFADRVHFLAYAARAMRGLTIDYARRRQARKRGGGYRISSSYGEPAAPAADTPEELEQLSAALDSLGAADAGLAQLVDLHFFAGFTLVEIAAMRGISERTAQRDWRKARMLLSHAIHGPNPPPDGHG